MRLSLGLRPVFLWRVDESTGGDDGALVFDGILVELGGGGVALQLDAVHVEVSLGEVVEVTTDD